MGSKHIAILLALLMLFVGVSQVSTEISEDENNNYLRESNLHMEVILPISQLNSPGFQEGSILSNPTIAGGGEYACAILNDGTISCWGSDIGKGNSHNQTNVPQMVNNVPDDRSATAIATGMRHTCAVLDNGTVVCWGINAYGQLGVGDLTSSPTPQLVSSLGQNRSAVAISAGESHSCAILNNGSVVCWGRGDKGQLGHSGSYDRTVPTLTDSLGPGRTAIAISAGEEYTCVILDNHVVSCWGLIPGTGSPTLSPTSIAQYEAVAISAGDNHICGLNRDGTISCWGKGDHGQLGNGGDGIKSTPTLTSSLPRPAIAVSSGASHTCALLDDGTVSCWGRGLHGQLGNGGIGNELYPTQTSALGRSAIAVSSNHFFTCAVLDNAQVSCWGAGSSGRLGNGGTNDQLSPTPVSNFGNNLSVALSERDLDDDGRLNIFQSALPLDQFEASFGIGLLHTCVILADGISCWGDDGYKQLGDGINTETDSSTPQLVYQAYVTPPTYSTKPVSMSSGEYHNCALMDDGKVWCWGENGNGQLGVGDGNRRHSPTETNTFGSGRSVVKIASGATHNCAILDDGSVSCWGQNANGRLGDGTQSTRYSPTQTNSLGLGRTAVDIAAGHSHTCAVLDDGNVSCWGSGGNGRLGYGFSGRQFSPILTSSLGAGRHAIAITAGFAHTCVLLDDGSVACWGSNHVGQLGNSGYSDALTPTQTSSFGLGRSAVAISAGRDHTCALLDDRSIACWGHNNYGQVGSVIGTNATEPTLVSTSNLSVVIVAIGTGFDHSCAVLENRSVICWGSGSHGKLGNGDSTSRTIPEFTSSYLASLNGARLYSADRDSDGFLDFLDEYPDESFRSVECDAGTYGRYLCVDAPVGTFSSMTGAAYPTDAFAGHYVSSAGQTSQTPCGNGTYNPSTRSTHSSACHDADPGYYVNMTGQANQSRCTPGTYQNAKGSSFCKLADAGFFVNSFGLINQTACSPGYYQPLVGQTNCIPASEGHFVNESGQPRQESCLEGTYQPNSSSVSCLHANPGNYVNQTGQSMQKKCGYGQYQPQSGQAECLDAPKGTYVNQFGQSEFKQCAAGSYQNQTGQASCVLAPIGYFVSDSRQPSPTFCSPGSYQDEEGKSACRLATAGYYVAASGQSEQIPCPVGKFNPDEGSDSADSCINAKAGYYVPMQGQNQEYGCHAGTYQDGNGMATCKDSEPGHFVSESSQKQQTACPIGEYQSLYGQYSCVQAEPGFFVESIAQINQTECLLGKYQPNPGQGNCLSTSPGYYTDVPGQAKQILCPLGTYQPAEESVDCIDAEIGFYVADSGLSEQIACPDFSSTISTGSTGLIDCKLDSDADRIPNVSDPDDDNDGVIDELDDFPFDATEWSDADGDGVGDNAQSAQASLDSNSSLFTPILTLVFVLVGTLMVLRLKSSNKKDTDDINSLNITDSKTKEMPPEIPPARPKSLDFDTITGPKHSQSSAQIEKDAIELSSPTGPPQGPSPKQTTPPSDGEGVIGNDGYEWIEFPESSGNHFYRAPGADSWETWDS